MRFIFIALFFAINVNAQILKKVFKYSTLYTAYTQTNSIQPPKTFYVTQSSELIETTRRNPADEVRTIGFRKLAFFGYEDKERFYDGNEQNNSINSNIGNVKGLEYLFEYQKGKQQGREFENKQYFIRYLAKWWIAKAELNQNQLIDLNYKSADLRLRIPLSKKLSISLGGIYRTYDKAYGHNPIQKYLEDNNWWNLSYEYGHYDIPYNWELADGQTGFEYFWFDQNDNLISYSDLDYRNSIYGRLVNRYNREQLALIGGFADVSSVIGLDFYHYRKTFWMHIYGNILPHHKLVEGDVRYSYGNFIGNDNWIDYSLGGSFGLRITRTFGLFAELTNQRWWDRELKTIKVGVNIKL
jgi:hypothetical protein